MPTRAILKIVDKISYLAPSVYTLQTALTGGEMATTPSSTTLRLSQPRVDNLSCAGWMNDGVVKEHMWHFATPFVSTELCSSFPSYAILTPLYFKMFTGASSCEDEP